MCIDRGVWGVLSCNDLMLWLEEEDTYGMMFYSTCTLIWRHHWLSNNIIIIIIKSMDDTYHAYSIYIK